MPDIKTPKKPLREDRNKQEHNRIIIHDNYSVNPDNYPVNPKRPDKTKTR